MSSATFFCYSAQRRREVTAMTVLDGFRTTVQVARRLDVSEQKVRQWAADGRLPCLATPHGRLFDPAVVERFAVERAAKQLKAAEGGGGGDVA
jgi:excisionase family DNA binding protein